MGACVEVGKHIKREWSQGGTYLMSINRIVVEEQLDESGHFGRFVGWSIVFRATLAVDAPFVNELLKHAIGAQLVDFAQPAEHFGMSS
jgi:hypothetical protein